MSGEARSSVDLYWLPLGAGGRFVRLNGRIFEALMSRLENRPADDLYHCALVVNVPEGEFVIEMAWPIPDRDGALRGVVAEGAVGSGSARSLRTFRYEIRRWRDGVIPDINEAVDSPQRLTDDPLLAQRVLELVPSVPTPVWGRDELRAGEMWNSNSLTSWLIARSGLDVEALHPPAGGRAPGWRAGLVVAHRQNTPPIPSDTGPRRPREPRAVSWEYLRHTLIVKPYFDATADSPLEAFAAEAARHPVFRISAGGLVRRGGGASSMYAWQFAKLQHAADSGGWTRVVSMQNQYNLLRRHDERELMAMCGDTGVGLVPYSPNSKGRLARRAGEQSNRSSTDKVVQAFDSPFDEPVINAVQRLAEPRSASMAQIALAWVLRNPLVTAPIVGATNPHHLPQAVDALGLELTDEEVQELEAPYQQYGPPWY